MSARLRGLGEHDRRVLDAALGLALAAVAVATVALSPVREGAAVGTGAVMAAMAISFVARRRQPLVTPLAVATGLVVLELWLTSPSRLPGVLLLLICAAFAVAVHAQRRMAVAGLLALATTTALVSLLATPQDVAFPVGVFTLAPWAVGRVLRGQTLLARELAEKEALLVHQREGEERHAAALERSRVARELHDVLAHSLSVMVIQASAARRVVEADPDAASEAAESIRRAGREALVELRLLFGPVHQGEGEDLAGRPGLAGLEALVERARRAGLPTTLRVEGDGPPLVAGADMAAYRVVQEALTNTIKHAGAARATVTVRRLDDCVVVEVEDDGAGPLGATSRAPGGGHGLVGMRERVALYGGELQAGRRRGGGFAVVARLPLAQAAATAQAAAVP